MTIPAPSIPTTIEESGISKELLLKLVAKVLHVQGTLTPSAIATEVRLPAIIVAALLKELQTLQMIEAKGLAGSDMRSEVRYALGGKGFEFAAVAMDQSQYVGPAPVSLDAWIAQIRAQSIANDVVSRESLQKSLSHLVLPDDLVDILGPAVNSARSVLLYGDPGNGKTSIAEAVGKAFTQQIYVPFCIEVGGQIINLIDPTVHVPVVQDEPTKFDARWQLCKRPCVITGGELNLDMLDLAYNPVSRFYEAPIHLKAMGGVFIVDDFGRQRTDPQSVLNRWIVPLESRYDHLTLHTGKKFSVPFDQLVMFSTNIEPKNLADAGGLRRLYYKLHIPTPTKEDFTEIFHNAAAAVDLEVDAAEFEKFYKKHYGDTNAIPAGHHPRYIIDFVRSVCTFRGDPVHMDQDLLHRGWSNLDTH